MTRFTDEWGHFTQMPELVIERSAELGTDAVFLFLYFRYRTNRERGCAFPTYDRMIEDVGWGRHRIKAAMDVLEENKLLIKRRRFQQSTEYYLVRPPDVPVPDAASAAPALLVSQESRSGTAASAAPAPPVVPPTEQDLDSLTYTESTQTNTRIEKDAARKRLELHFRSITSLHPPKRKTEAAELWWVPLQEIAELANWRADVGIVVIDECWSRARDRFQVSSPKSILKTARAVVAERANGRQSAESDAEYMASKRAAAREALSQAKRPGQ